MAYQGEVEVITGILNTGEATGVPIIRELLAGIPKDRTIIVDCPPGSACSVMESIKDANFCLMVAEPTVFGIHNLDMVCRLVKLFGKPHAIVVNKDMGDRTLIEKYCSDNDIKIIASIPYDSELALANSKGFVVAQEYEKYMGLFKGIIDTIEKEVCHEAACNTER
jgi:MinD superfamily P-loop ATPase